MMEICNIYSIFPTLFNIAYGTFFPVVLTKANELLTYVHLNAGRHTLKKRRLLCLAELPELLVDLFELITDEPIPGKYSLI